MEELKTKIRQEGIVIGNDVLKVDSFLNHQIDPKLMKAIGREFAKRFEGCLITKILTVESSGIAPAMSVAHELSVPVVYAKKTSSRITDADVYESNVFSFTKNKKYKIRVSRKFITKDDCVLIIDDFLANGQAILGLYEIITKSGASFAGAGIVIEKGFQGGGDMLRKMGIRVESLAIVENMSETKILFK